MKRYKKYLVFFLFGLSWLALFWLTGSRTPWMMFQETAAEDGIVVSLGDLAGSNYDRMGFPSGIVRYVPADDSWIVGTDRGELIHVTRKGRELWTHSLGTGEIEALEISPDGKTAYVGEKSPDGFLYAVSTKTGDILWKFSGGDVIGSEPALRSSPAPVHIAVDEAGNVYAALYRYSVSADQKRAYISRLVAFASDGRELWRYPKNENMDAWVTWDSAAAGRVAFGTSNYENTENIRYGKHAYILDAATGEEVATVSVPVKKEFGVAVFRNGPNFSADGQIFVMTASDGRGFVFDKDGKLLWEREISGIRSAGSITINASGRDAYVLPTGDILFGTINTFARENWQMPAPVLHPSSNTIFVFQADGTFRWKYQAAGEIEETAFAADTIAIAVGRNVRTHDYSVHGAQALDAKTGKLLLSKHTKGPVQNVAVSSDGKTLAATELPAVTPEGTLLGAYRLHIWDVGE